MNWAAFSAMNRFKRARSTRQKNSGAGAAASPHSRVCLVSRLPCWWLVSQRPLGNGVGQRALPSLSDRNAASAKRQLYVAKMNLAHVAWEQNNVRRVRELLDETATAPERGFEWYYWQRRMHLELKAPRGHIGPILAVAYSPDGKRIVTGSGDRTIKVWEAATADQVERWHKEEQTMKDK